MPGTADVAVGTLAPNARDTRPGRDILARE